MTRFLLICVVPQQLVVHARPLESCSLPLLFQPLAKVLQPLLLLLFTLPHAIVGLAVKVVALQLLPTEPSPVKELDAPGRG